MNLLLLIKLLRIIVHCLFVTLKCRFKIYYTSVYIYTYIYVCICICICVCICIVHVCLKEIFCNYTVGFLADLIMKYCIWVI